MIFRSPHPDVAVPDIALHRLVLARAAERGTKPALIDGPSGRILTYAALTRGADRVAAGLAARGFQKGDVLGLFMPHLPPLAAVFHGTLAAGGVVTTINSLATEQDVEHQLRNAGARVAQLVLNVLLGGQGIEIGRATSELQSPCNLVCRLLLEKKKKIKQKMKKTR